MKKIVQFLAVTFFEKGIMVDLPVAILGYYLINKFQLFTKQILRGDLVEITDSLIGTFISISGFSLAALTIIITIRANIIGKENYKPSNGLENLMYSDSYFKVTGIFRQIILIQALSALALYISWLCFTINSREHFYVILLTCYTLSTSIIRLFYILFTVLALEKLKKQKPNIAQLNE